MSKKVLPKTAARLEIRLGPDLLKAVQARAKDKRYRSTGEYVRALMSRDVGGANDADPLANFEKIAAANHNRLLGSLRKVHVVQRATYALIDSYVKAALSYLPEPGPTGRDLARSRGKERYERVLKTAETASFELLDVLSAQMERETETRSAKSPV